MIWLPGISSAEAMHVTQRAAAKQINERTLSPLLQMIAG
jgi:hypothetical protein